jgi:hypothetical protein
MLTQDTKDEDLFYRLIYNLGRRTEDDWCVDVEVAFRYGHNANRMLAAA